MGNTFRSAILLSACAISVVAPAVSAALDTTNVPRLNAKVLQYCNDHMGERVGNGQCSALAVQAIHAAGGRGRSKAYPAWNDYVWGKEICFIEGTEKGTHVSSGVLGDVKPGDIAQFS